MAKVRTETWLALIVLPIGLIPAAVLGLWGFMSATATTLHPNPAEAPSVARSAPPPRWTETAAEAQQIVRRALGEENVPGLSVAVGIGGDIVWAEGFGWADLERRVPVAPEMTFRIGTASTVLTSAAVGLLLERNQLALDEEIQSYVPEFPRKPFPVTLRQVMGHLSGIRNDGGDEGPLLSARCSRPVDAFQHFGERELLFEPGTRYHYSSYGWVVVSAAVEAAANQPFLAFMWREVFEPLGMTGTQPESATDPVPGRVTLYFPRFMADPRYGLHLMRPLEYSCYAGASVFLSTPSDLVRFGMAMNEGRLLQPATLQMLQTPQRLTSGAETGYGLGWELGSATLANQQTRWAGHDGNSLGGPVASLMTFPEQEIAVSVISNISYTNTRAMALRIAQAFGDGK